MTTKTKTQRFTTNSGSFQNLLMSNNSTLPVAGEYATFMHYTDRHVDLVREVSADGKTVTMEQCETVANGTNLPMGHQCWKHIPTGYTYKLVWRNNKWRTVGREIVFTEEFRNSVPSAFIGIWLRKNNPELADAIYGDHIMPCNVVEGITREKKTYTPVRVLFGTNDYHYDWSF